MTYTTALIRSAILESFTDTLSQNGVEDITVHPLDEADKNRFPKQLADNGRLSLAALESVAVEFLADQKKMGRLIKSLVVGANAGKFGNHKIYISST